MKDLRMQACQEHLRSRFTSKCMANIDEEVSLFFPFKRRRMVGKKKTHKKATLKKHFFGVHSCSYPLLKQVNVERRL